MSALVSAAAAATTKKIVVIGDVMLDINYMGKTTPRRAAPENSAILIKPIENTQVLLGGAANVALALHNLDCDIILLGVIGNDDAGKKIMDLLDRAGVAHQLWVDSSRPTTQKHRVFHNDTLVTRFDIESTEEIPAEIQRAIVAAAAAAAETIIFSDYDKGVLTENICQTLIKSAPYTFVDPKIKNYKKYRGCFCFKPNFYEASVISGFILQNSPATHIQNNQMCRDIMWKLYELIHCRMLVLTDGANGIYVNEDTQEEIKHICVAAAAGGGEIVDVTGAGDIVMAVLVYVFSEERDIYRAATVANYFGTKSVYCLGNYQITHADIVEGMNQLKMRWSPPQTPRPQPPALHLEYPHIDITPEQLHEHAARKGKKIVFTNGCFDIVHTAHLQLLNFCRTQGHMLVIGLNSDDSIRRLKGPSRPINSYEDRAAFLGELNFVDYIFVFHEDTPHKLLSRLRPSVIVKGGDYTEDTVVGREFAERVSLFHYIKDKSTTRTIDRVRRTTAVAADYKE